MCLIIVKPAGVKANLTYIIEGWDFNKDGGGFVYADRGKLYMAKYLTKVYYLKAVKEALEAYPASPFLFHTRIATHGPKTLRNVHPFWVNDDLVMAHNGVISIETPTGGFSDTVLFNESYLKHLPANFLDTKAETDKIAEIIGLDSKLAFLDSSGEHTIIHEANGKWDEDCWYSNNSYKPVSYYHGRQDWENPEVKVRNSKFCNQWRDDEQTVLMYDSIMEGWATPGEKTKAFNMTPEEYVTFVDELGSVINA